MPVSPADLLLSTIFEPESMKIEWIRSYSPRPSNICIWSLLIQVILFSIWTRSFSPPKPISFPCHWDNWGISPIREATVRILWKLSKIANFHFIKIMSCILGVKDETEPKHAMNYMRSCPSPKKLFPETVRRPLRDLVSGTCPRLPSAKRISALEFRVRLTFHFYIWAIIENNYYYIRCNRGYNVIFISEFIGEQCWTSSFGFWYGNNDGISWRWKGPINAQFLQCKFCSFFELSILFETPCHNPWHWIYAKMEVDYKNIFFDFRQNHPKTPKRVSYLWKK